MKTCPNCNSQIADDSRFCSECGKPIPQGKSCPHCGASVDDGDLFCPECGKRLIEESKEDSSTESAKESPEKNIEENEEVAEVATEEYDMEEDASNKLKKFIPIGIVAALLVVGGVWWYLSSSKVDETNYAESINEEMVSLEENEIETGTSSETPFSTNSVSYRKTSPTSSLIEVEINVDFPTQGSDKLKEGIAMFIIESLTNDFTLDDEKNPRYTSSISDGQGIVSFYGNNKIKELEEVYGIGAAKIFINKVFENDLNVSYEVKFSGNSGGSGIGTHYGVTFDKNSGTRKQVIKNPNDSQFKTFLISRVEDALGETNYELREHPFPQYSPFLTKDGVCFIYQKYEIGSGMLGEVQVTIPYHDLTDYIND